MICRGSFHAYEDDYFNSLRPSDAYLHQETKPTWIQIMDFRFLVPSHYLNQCCLIVDWTLQWSLNPNLYFFYQRKYTWKCHLQYGGHFILALMCWPWTNQTIIPNMGMQYAGIVLWMRPANEGRRYIVTLSVIGWVLSQNDPWVWDSLFQKVIAFNTLRARQNGRHFTDSFFKCICFNEKVWISITIPSKLVPKGQIDKIPALVEIMAWRRPGDKTLSEPLLVRLPTHICVTRPQWVNTVKPVQNIFAITSTHVMVYHWWIPYETLVHAGSR